MGAAAGLLVGASLALLVPVAAVLGARRRLGVALGVAGFGALAFAVSQLLLRLPLHLPLQVWVQGHATGRPGREVAWLLGSALSAALFEEPARWAMYRWALKTGRSWRVGVMAGLGHGGLESVALVGLPVAGSLVAYLLLSQGHTLGLPPQALGLLRGQFQGLTFSLAALGGVERLFALVVHVALSLLVLQGFVRGQRRWLWAAVVFHFSSNASAALALRWLGPWAAEGVIGSFALLALAMILWAHRREAAAPGPK